MTSVYLLFHMGHEPAEGEDEDEAMLLGVFSSEQAALAWQRDALQLPGFRDWPERFEIAEYVVDQRKWPDGFETVRWTPEVDALSVPLGIAAAEDLLLALQRWEADGGDSHEWRHQLTDEDGDELTLTIRPRPKRTSRLGRDIRD